MTYGELKAYSTADDEQRRKVQRFVESVTDPQTRQMFELRFLKGLKYHQVAMQLGGGMSASCVKMRIGRYMKRKH